MTDRNDDLGSSSQVRRLTRRALLVHCSALALSGTRASAHGHQRPARILVVGDSLSAEYGLARGSGWVALLEQRLKERDLPATVINASISGDTT
ncbi:MAG TPA: hypothetical protein VFP68_14175, partial [Burkholderiaceae bacterium]|nr:hypothetical protein [Burkholderiaceae bacterium]